MDGLYSYLRRMSSVMAFQVITICS
jgi:hypothetical protein